MPDREEVLIEQRRSKLQKLRAAGIDPYPPRYRRTHTAKEAAAIFDAFQTAGGTGHTTEEVSVAGRITALRGMGKATFLDVRDGSGKIQAYLRRDRFGEKYELLKEFELGDFIGVTGPVFVTHTGEKTVEANDFVMLCKALRPLPEKWHGLVDVEKRYRQRYLDLISNEKARQVFQVRTKVISAIRRYLDGRGFVELETPILVPVAAGAMATPFVTHHEALDRDLYLRIALELYLKRLIIGGIDKVYEMGRVFRNEGISVKHNPEFTLLETYEAYADYNAVMDMVEQMVYTVATQSLGSAQTQYAGKTMDFTPPWKRITLREAILQKSGIDFEEFPDAQSLASKMQSMKIEAKHTESRGKLIDKLLSVFVEPTLFQPTFLLEYPVDMSPLAKRKPEDSRYVERFEGFAGGMEIANAFSELNDPIDQRERFMEQERLRGELGDQEFDRLDEDFLVAVEHGMPPTGGLGMGIDRLVMLMTDQQSVREVIPFPQLREK